MRSRSGRGFLLHLSLCAALSVTVGFGFYYLSLNWFKEHKSSEKIIALQLVDAFVTNYSAIRAQFGPGAPVPASFRAHAIEAFNKQNGDNSEFRLAWVGRPGREILTPPSDVQMARTIEAFAATTNPKPESELLEVNGERVFRTVYPTAAREQSCVSCHNALQPDKAMASQRPHGRVRDRCSNFAFSAHGDVAKHRHRTGSLPRAGTRGPDHFSYAFPSTGSSRCVRCKARSHSKLSR